MARAGFPFLKGIVLPVILSLTAVLRRCRSCWRKQRPQAVFIGNDAMAFGAYQALYQAGLRVPHDMAVIGYDDIELASYMTPPLTTIHQPKDELGELAIDVLIHRMAQPTLQQQRLQLTPVLMERGSV
jgi:LacI family transcriptional regulator